MNDTVISIVGPTASGKTDVAIHVAQIIGGEIVSADSRLVYKDFNIGTAKPTAEALAIVPHHMIDIAAPAANYTVGRYKKEAEIIIQDILIRGKIPIITGGTGFYIKALLEGLDIPEVDPDIEFREQMRKLAEEKGRGFLHDMLMEQDSQTAQKLYRNDCFRIIRALEVQRASGKPMSEVQSVSIPEYKVFYAGLNAENREFLYERINQRVDIMLENGLIDEVKYLINKYGKTVSLLKTLGYKEICAYLEGDLALNGAVEEIKKNTRNFAKRQLTWFRANKKINWHFIDKISKDEISHKIVKDYIYQTN